MDKCDYDEKMTFMLSNEKMYKPLQQDPAQEEERKMNALLLLQLIFYRSQVLTNALRQQSSFTTSKSATVAS